MSATTIDNTLGALFLGNLTAAILYGVTCVQTFMYFQNYSRDTLSLRITVFFLWICDTVHIAIVTHSVYFYAVTNFSNPLALGDATVSVMSHLIITSISDITIRYVFGRRLWQLSGGNVPLAISIGVTSLVVFCSSMAFTSLGIRYKAYSKFYKISYLLYLALGSGVVVDTIMALALCIVLAKSRTGFRRTDSLINVLMMYTINTGLLTSIVALLGLIMYAVMPQTYACLAIIFNLSKLYFNALLATLNARSGLRDQMNRPITVLPVSEIAKSGSDTRSKGIPTSPHITINIEGETKPESLNESTGGY